MAAVSLGLVYTDLAPSAALGQACGVSDSGTAIDCGGEKTTVVPLNQTPTNRGSSSRSSTPAKKYLPYDRLTTGPDGEPCMTTGYYEEGTSPTDGVSANPANPQPFIYTNLADSYPPCPQAPRQASDPAPVETPRMVAARFWEQVPLPKPAPSIAPGRAITGKLAYLETNGEITHTYTNDTTFGPLHIVAKGSYSVDWGDGETTGPYDIEGRPWPNGEITHDYVNIGVYDVVVTEKWTATWRLGGQSGVLRTLQTTGTIGDFPVEQLQAVIGR
jgi:hypothetical protein